MSKENQIKYLEEYLEEITKLYLKSEVEYRVLLGMAMGKPRDEVMAAEGKAKQAKTFFESQIRQIKGLMEEVKKGAINV